MIKYLLSVFVLAFSLIGRSQEQDSLIVYFGFDSFALNEGAKKQLQDFTVQLENQVVEIVSLAAYCDKKGSEKYNLNLAQNRMSAITSQLSLYTGFSEKRIIGEDYHQLADYKAESFRKVVIVYSKVSNEEVVEIPVQSSEAELLTNKFVEFLQDSTVQEASIDISILFIPGMDDFLMESEPELWALFDFLNYNPTINVEIHGHVCCSDDYPLSVARAFAVYQFVTTRGISPERLSYQGHSNSLPAVSPEITEEDMKQNRRVSVTVKK